MVHAISPCSESHCAEATSTVDIVCDGFPAFGRRHHHITAMEEPQVLAQVVFAIECPRIETLFLALTMIVRLYVIARWIVQIAVDAF